MGGIYLGSPLHDVIANLRIGYMQHGIACSKILQELAPLDQPRDTRRVIHEGAEVLLRDDLQTKPSKASRFEQRMT